MRLFLVILGVVIAVTAILFALQNSVITTIVFGIWRVEGSLALVLLLTMAVGFSVGILALIPTILQKNWKIANHKKRITELEKDSNEKIEKISSQRKRIDYLENSLKLEIGQTPSTQSEPTQPPRLPDESN
ncbi:lipopolysaccharide assembly protein LapA domain-containing protein [Lyngbya aestuarii]|uniref:lipopolysaccharide assembly protein LapA domain-containing protein n=1 Tax=Lyngbya aestuarii TaxID=118322 RepID=UPI00403D8B8A